MGTHPIFESDFDCLTDAEALHVRGKQKSIDVEHDALAREDRRTRGLASEQPLFHQIQGQNCEFEADRPCDLSEAAGTDAFATRDAEKERSWKSEIDGRNHERTS